MENCKPKVLMVGPGRTVMGGISTVVNLYYESGLADKVNLKYISSMEDGNKIKKLFVALRAYIQFCNNIQNYDILHVHMAAQASFTRKALFIKKAHKYGKRIIIHQHSADFDEFYFNQCSNEKRTKVKNIFAMADKIIVLSEKWSDFFGANICNSEKIHVLYNGVRLPGYIKTDYSDHNLLFLGRLGNRKGSYDLIAAAAEVVKKVPDAMFYLGGDGEIKKSKAIIEEKGLTKNIHFLGWVKDNEKIGYLKKCSLFVLPSYHEGMPMSVLESMSYGLATISTNVGGIPQVIENGINGIRIEAGDVAGLAKTIICLMQNEEKKRRLGVAAVKHIAEKFDITLNVNKLSGIYAELICDGGEL